MSEAKALNAEKAGSSSSSDSAGRRGQNAVTSFLKNPNLIREKAFIGGQWKDADNGQRLEVTNPADGSILGTVPNVGERETSQAIEMAQQAFKAWAEDLPQNRARILRRWADLMIDNKEDLALIMTLEQGKPLTEAQGEIDYAASFLEWFGEEGKRLYGDVVPSHLPGSKMIVSQKPVGVAALITPWNFPSAMLTRKAGAALAAGCPVVCRPAEETPYSALALCVLAQEAGLPDGLLSVLTGKPEPIVDTMLESTTVRKVSFTGSTEIGRLLLEKSAATVKKTSMELGGHAPFIVFPDADLDKALTGGIGAKFATTGQDCLAVNRLFVHDSLYDEYARRFTRRTEKMRLGNGLDNGVELGPLMHDRAVAKCVEHVKDALDKGAELLCGGQIDPELGGNFFQATVLGNVTPEMKIYREETFGPVTPLIRYQDEEEVVQAANDSEYGLAAYIYTQDLNRAHRVADALEYGMVGINTPKFTGAPVPFGGVKQSGLGREGSRHGIEEYTQLQYHCLGGL